MQDNQTLSHLKQALKARKAEKGEISGQFKLVERGSDEFAALKKRMAEISQEVKDLEASLKAAKQAENESEDKPEPEPQKALKQFRPVTRTFGNAIQVQLHQDEIPQAWWDFIATCDTNTPHHNQGIANSISRCFGQPMFCLIAYDELGSILGGLPLFISDSPLFGRFATSIPFFNYGGPLSAYSDVESALMDALPAIARSLSLKHIEVRMTHAVGDYAYSDKKVSMIRALPGYEATLNEEIGAKVRAQVNKGASFGLSATFGRAALLDDFYYVFSRNMRDLGTPVYAKSWFGTLLAELGDNAEIGVVYKDNKPVSACFLIRFNKMVEIPWASTVREANPYNANMWMYYQVLSRCIAHGAKWFDFGRSTQDAGTYRFKRQWGAKPVQHYWYTATENGFIEAGGGLNPDNPKYRLAIAVWQRTPLPIVNWVGPYISRYLP